MKLKKFYQITYVFMSKTNKFYLQREGKNYICINKITVRWFEKCRNQEENKSSKCL